MKKILLLFAAIISASPGYSLNTGTYTITGLLYSTGESVSVVIENGRIAAVEKNIDPDDSNRFYIALELIDIQINGYLGVDFSNQSINSEDFEDVVMYSAENVLAGFASPLIRSVNNMIRFTGCSVADAIQMASTNPARLLELTNRGEIKPGKIADLILFRRSGDCLEILKTIVNGEVVYSADIIN